VGIYSAALKKERLSAEGYAALIAATTQLNTPGPELAGLAGVHAMTDVTGFGLAGHALEVARGAGVCVELSWESVPMLPGVRELAAQGLITGASGRNWAAYGAEVQLRDGFAEPERALLCDPQTAGGLLVSCSAEALEDVRAVFARHGFERAALVGRISAGSGLRLT
jgi:selenide,water dikinase